VKYELWTELVYFTIYELNFELVHVESEISQRWLFASEMANKKLLLEYLDVPNY